MRVLQDRRARTLILTLTLILIITLTLTPTLTLTVAVTVTPPKREWARTCSPPSLDVQPSSCSCVRQALQRPLIWVGGGCTPLLHAWAVHQNQQHQQGSVCKGGQVGAVAGLGL